MTIEEQIERIADLGLIRVEEGEVVRDPDLGDEFPEVDTDRLCDLAAEHDDGGRIDWTAVTDEYASEL